MHNPLVNSIYGNLWAMGNANIYYKPLIYMRCANNHRTTNYSSIIYIMAIVLVCYMYIT